MCSILPFQSKGDKKIHTQKRGCGISSNHSLMLRPLAVHIVLIFCPESLLHDLFSKRWQSYSTPTFLQMCPIGHSSQLGFLASQQRLPWKIRQ